MLLKTKGRYGKDRKEAGMFMKIKVVMLSKQECI
jgi:hypothetical protein